MSGEPAFFEIGVGDIEQGRRFYGAMFGWELAAGPNGAEAGLTVQTANLPGGLHGGDAGAVPYLFFAVDDMDEALQRVRDLGGSVEDVDVEGDAESITRFGRFTLCRDDQGSRFGLHQAPR